MTRPTRLLLAVLLATAALPGWAQTRPTPPAAADAQSLPDWEYLSAQQRQTLLDSLRQRWNDAPADQRERMLHHAQRWGQMTPDQRDRARDGMRRYDRMSPEQRLQARTLFEQMRQLSPPQREALREQWRRMSPQQRLQWVHEHARQDD